MKLWRNKKSDVFLLITLFLICLFLYLKTLLPSYDFHDVGEMQTITYTFDIPHPTGYPTYLILGRIFISLFPFGTIAWRMNLFSSLTAILGVCFLYLILRKIFSLNNFLSFISCLIMATGQILWHKALKAEVHTLHFCLSSLFFYFLLKSLKNPKEIISAGFLLGISLGNHLLSLFYLPIFLLFLTRIFLIQKDNKNYLFNSFFVFSLTTIFLYSILIIIAKAKPPLTFDYNLATISGFKRHILGQDFYFAMWHWTKGNLTKTLSYFFNLLLKQFNFIILLFAFLGFLIQWKKPFVNLALLLIFILPTFFSLNYQNNDLDRYFLVPFLIIIILSAIGFNYLLDKIKTNILFFIFLSILIFIPIINIKKNYSLVDQSKNFAAVNYVKEVLTNVEKNGTIISWWHYSTPLWYAQLVEHQRPDITIYNLNTAFWENKAIEELNKGKNVYAVMSFDPLNPSIYLKQKGPLFQILKND